MGFLKKTTKKDADKNTGETKAIPASHAQRTSSPLSGLKPSRYVLRRPYMSEKAHSLSTFNQYVFLVDPSANKNVIREEVQRHYGVTVIAMNIVRKMGKPSHWKNRSGTKEVFKKAIVTLKAGQKIDST